MSANSDNQEIVGQGQQPKASPAARGWAIFLGLLLLALAVMAGRETWLVATDANASSWVTPVTDLVARENLETWMIWAGVAAVVVGLIFLIVAFKPRRKTHMRLESERSSVWLRAVDVARRSSAVARQVPGVAAARTQATDKNVKITVNGDTEDPALAPRVEEAVSQALQTLESTPRVSVTVEPVQEVETNV
ncbi:MULTISPECIES: DUF6286 domain-containing protein [unclassified Corynebacterium]|nr:DUF6286 domain-containing protein [Mycobacteriaceae bacterium]MDY5828421.1 DUF6286 domain-containing protein [Corynebacterium sp.]